MSNVNSQKKPKMKKKSSNGKISLQRNNSMGSDNYNDNDEKTPHYKNEDFKSKNKAKMERMRHRSDKKKCILYPED